MGLRGGAAACLCTVYERVACAFPTVYALG